MSGIPPGGISIQPIQIGVLPRPLEGSKGAPFIVKWSSVPVMIGRPTTQVATINLLQQFQTAQFTTIQAVYIDNSTCKVAVDFTCLETGQSVRCPAFGQGMYPLASAVAPIFTLALATSFASGPSGGQSTKIVLLNTPQRSYQPPAIAPVYTGGNAVVTSPATGPVQFTVIDNAGLADTNLYMRLLGFQLSIFNAGPAAFGGNTGINIALLHNHIGYWVDNFNVTAASFGAIYSKAVQFPVPSDPVDMADTWQLLISATTIDGVIYQFNYYYDLVIIK